MKFLYQVYKTVKALEWNRSEQKAESNRESSIVVKLWQGNIVWKILRLSRVTFPVVFSDFDCGRVILEPDCRQWSQLTDDTHNF